MKTQFTKGPWILLRQGKEIHGEGDHEIISIINGIPVLIAMLPISSENSEGENTYIVEKNESLANGRILAQSPAMYETLKEAQARIFMKYGNDELYEKIMGILAAVEGEG